MSEGGDNHKHVIRGPERVKPIPRLVHPERVRLHRHPTGTAEVERPGFASVICTCHCEKKACGIVWAEGSYTRNLGHDVLLVEDAMCVRTAGASQRRLYRVVPMLHRAAGRPPGLVLPREDNGPDHNQK